MKKLVLFITCLLIATSTLWAADFFKLNGLMYCYTSGGVAVTFTIQNPMYKDYNHAQDLSGNLTIPSSVTYHGTTYSVIGIGRHAFDGCHYLTSVTIPNSVTYIEEYAFYGCYGLTSVTIPNSVTDIGEYAFEGCSELTSVTIGNGVTSIGKGAFSGCTGLTSITIGNSVTYIGDTFSGCTGLTAINVAIDHPYYTSIDGVLYEKKGILIRYPAGKAGSFTIPNSVTSIRDYAFCNCSKLTSVTIPNSITYIGDYAFASCSGLTSVTIPNSVTYIGGHAFAGCSELTSVTIPNSINRIWDYAFYNCSGLTSVTIPNSVKSIGETAFYGCSGLTKITCKAVVPPAILEKTFRNEKNTYFYNIPLYVPAGSVQAYKNHAIWGKFTNIYAIGSEGSDAIAEATGSNAQIFGGEKRIVINNAANATVAIYDVMGRTVVKEQRINTNNAVFAMPQTGIYIVRMGKAAKKVWVK